MGAKLFCVIAFSILIALMLSILPLPVLAGWFRPAWVLLVLIYWALAMPYQFGLGIAWVAGLFLDILNGAVLGEHALSMVLVVYLVAKFHQRIRQFPFWQQMMTVGGLVVLNRGLTFWIQGSLGQLSVTWLSTLQYWLPVLTTVILWPWLSVLLESCQERFNLQ